MFKKGLVTLVCLIVMSAVWSWATTTYTVSTEISSLGTKLVGGVYTPVKGGSIKTRIVGADPGVWKIALQELGMVGTTALLDEDVEVQIAAADGYKISSVTKTVATPDVNGVFRDVTTPVAVAADELKAKTFVVDGPTTPNKTQYFKITFAADTATNVVKKTWQLQATNNNGGGSFTVTRAASVTPYATVGKPLVTNFIDTTPVTVAATPKAGYTIDYVVVNGVKDNTDRATYSATVNGTPRLSTFNFGYKKDSIQVTTTTVIKSYLDAPANTKPVYDDLGILPVNPVADPYGVVRLIVAPTGSQNQVTAINANGGIMTLTDRFGDPVTLPYTGAVKVTIKGITAPISVTADYGTNVAASAQYTSCTQTCHVDPALVVAKPYVQAADTQWLASGHRAKNVDCIDCHSTMPGNIVKGSVDQETFNITDAKAGAVGSNYCSKCHATSVNKVLASAHYTKPSGAMACTDCHAAGHNPAGNRAACATCHTYVNEHTAENTAGKGCVECHDKHNPATITGTLGTPTAHPAVTLYTFEEIGMQMAGGQKVPVQVDANGKGMPYSPKQTCGTSGCHVKGGVDYTYDKISDHAFHSNEGRSEYQDSATGKFDATKNKPWVQSAAMVGKW